ncbi:peptidoglycan DD-metalloendopeptidase family protein [Cellulomonas fimi]|uniref:Peptidase M23 n=1 Tax=Cellulomonas fimi (strain ATCC 484 / DSM 20113 / JCM 1341 / CCUG 24087 / LMG 16345 / NBRC 15513 / NCIMB 8980 / NCTC 7547 / NRS-133) TaxID=590998 RepID=F4H5Z7_CELFA|nr:M23 family metallopeptidase [Cellulomonas fimi]AEE46727.1 Peptidase M23 [Cellulomonas fimi ATCC 484]VEH34003.1 Glycyl-glycine endopeptidase ALE-1 precursor [Cellulomonas fimi]
MRRRLRLPALLAAACLLVGVAVASPAVADEIDDRRKAAEQKAAANEKAQADAEAAMEGLDASLQATASRLLELQAQIPAAQARLDEAKAALEKAQREAAIIAARLVDAQEQQVTLSATIQQDTEQAEKMRAAIGQMAREAYRGGAEVSGVSVILDAESSEDFVERYGLVSTALRTQAQVLDALKAAEASNRNAQARLDAVEDRITELKAEADQKVVEADAARDAAEDAKATLDGLVAEQQAQQATLESQKAALASALAAMDAEAKAIENELRAAIDAQRARDAAAGKPAPAPGPVGSSLFGNPTSISPIYVTSEYGMRLHPTLGYVRLHAGIDLRTYCSTKVYAGRAGTVTWAKTRYGFGNQVMIDSGFVNGNAVSASYNHLTSFAVSSGQRVERGQLIGYSGNTGTSAACHLHFEVYVNGSTVNPRPLLGL